MTEAYDGRQVVGMDLHRRRSVLVRMTGDGRKLGTVRITSTPAALRAEIAKAGEHPRVVLEATYGWYWAADVLEEAGAGVHLALPQPYAGKVASLRQLAGALTGEITLLDKVTADLLAGHEGYAAIQALPGIGPVLAAVIVAEIGDIRRFPGPGQLGSRAGLTP